MKKLIDWLTKKDNLIGIGIAAFLGLFGGMIVPSFEVTSLFWAWVGVAGGTLVAALFKESRRGVNEVRPDKFYMPYIVGGILGGLLFTVLWCIAFV